MEKTIMTQKLFTLLTFALLTMGAAAQTVPDTLLFVFKLHGQTRRFEMSFEERNDSVRLTWGIERKLKWLSGRRTTWRTALRSASCSRRTSNTS